MTDTDPLRDVLLDANPSVTALIDDVVRLKRIRSIVREYEATLDAGVEWCDLDHWAMWGKIREVLDEPILE